MADGYSQRCSRAMAPGQAKTTGETPVPPGETPVPPGETPVPPGEMPVPPEEMPLLPGEMSALLILPTERLSHCMERVPVEFAERMRDRQELPIAGEPCAC